MSRIWDFLKKHRAVAFAASFLLALVVAVFVFVAYVIIDFIANLVVESGVQGSFALHHGFIGWVVFAVCIFGVFHLHYYEGERNRTYKLFWVLSVSMAVFGLLLMFNDIYDLPRWFLFQH